MSKIVTEFNKFMKIKEVKKYIGVHSINIPNFWSVIEYGKNSYETRYSRMIRWLLDATETHGQGNFFANELIKLSHSKNKEIKNLPVVKSGHAKCEALGSNIDIFFIDEQEKITITIELKMWSSDHANNGKHQLDKYYNTVITNYPPKKGYQNYYFYITINGVAPNIVAMNRAKKEWTNISYNEISPIIAAMKKRIMKDKLQSEDWKLSTLKIIGDFHDDMNRIYSKYQFITAKNIINWKNKLNPSLRNEFKQLKNYYVHNKRENSEIDEKCINFLVDLNKAYLENQKVTEEKLSYILELIDSIIIEQNHSANEDVHRLMSEIFLNFADNKEGAKEALFGASTTRKAKIKKDIISKTGFQYVWMTSGKGQGLRFFKEDMQEMKYRPAIKLPYVYFSGDYSQKIFNDGVTYSLEKDNNASGKITYANLLKLSGRSKEDFLSKNITQNSDITKFVNFLIELLHNTQNFEEIIEQKRNNENAQINKFADAISLVECKKQKD